MQECYIETADELAVFCGKIAPSAWLALDTEFIREKTYYPQLCLLQISNGTVAACIDPLKLNSLEPLLEIIMNPAIVKIFHAGRQDLEIFHHQWQRVPGPVFDTQLAAALLGLGEQIGYANLVKQLLGVELSKSHTRADWSLRPLQEGQLRYALDDVVYLGRLYTELRTRLAEKDRLNWMTEEFEQLADNTTYAVDPRAAWNKIRGTQKLTRSQLAVLRELAAWRENRAMAANRPRRWIVKDELLVELARKRPADMQRLEAVRGMEGELLKREGEHLLNLIRQAQRSPRDEWPTVRAPSVRLSPNQEAMVDLLQCSLRLLAETHQMTPAALATRKSLELLTAGERDLELLQGWRKQLAGKSLLDVLEGRLVPEIRDGRLILTLPPS